MRLNDEEQQWERERPEPQIQEIEPDTEKLNPIIPNIDIQELIEEERKRWDKQETPEARL